MDELTKKWEEFGLLVGLTNVEKTMLALNFERTALHIISDSTNKYSRVDMYIFPVLRRISVTHTNENGLDVYQYYHVNPIDVLEHFTNHMNSREAQDLISYLKTYSSIDWEAEICALYSENFYFNFRNKPMEIKPVKYVKKHRL